MTDKTLRDDAAFVFASAIIINQGLGAGIDVIMDQAYSVADAAIKRRAK
jgi:hypothetical protein